MLTQYKTYSTEESLLAQIEPFRLEQYLQSHGWAKVDGLSNTRRSVYEIKGKGKNIRRQVKVLYDRSFSDYATVLLITIANIAECESRTVDDIIRHLIVPTKSDVLRIRAFGDSTTGGTISLNVAREMLEGIRRVVLAAAQGVSKPQSYYARLGDGKADDLIKKCLLGQTEVGSFIFTVILPLYAEHESNLFDQEPFARKVTKGLLISLNKIAACRTEKDCDELTNQESERISHPRTGVERPLISKNLCDAIIDILANSDSNVEFSVDWSADFKSSESPGIQHVSFSQNNIELLDYISRELTPADHEIPNSYFGTVEKCEGTPTGDMLFREGDVVVRVADDEGEPRNARIKLTMQEYEKAINAHRTNRKVLIKGVLKRIGRTYRIISHESFELC